jgi:hypothetical protein
LNALWNGRLDQTLRLTIIVGTSKHSLADELLRLASERNLTSGGSKLNNSRKLRGKNKSRAATLTQLKCPYYYHLLFTIHLFLVHSVRPVARQLHQKQALATVCTTPLPPLPLLPPLPTPTQASNQTSSSRNCQFQLSILTVNPNCQPVS